MSLFDIELIEIDDCRALMAIRSCLEEWDLKIFTNWIGQPNQLVEVLNGERIQSKNIFISAHGDERGFKMMELDSKLESIQAFSGKMTPNDVNNNLSFNNNNIVLSTACMTGSQEMGKAFLNAGASYYIGPNGYPDANAALYYSISFYYNLFCNQFSVEVSHTKASNHDEETQLFTLYKL